MGPLVFVLGVDRLAVFPSMCKVKKIALVSTYLSDRSAEREGEVKIPTSCVRLCTARWAEIG